MSILVILLNARPRSSLTAAEAMRPPADYAYAYSPDGLIVGSHGRAAASRLPRADSVVVALSDTDVGWHRINLPKAPPARLRAALSGVLEDALLDEPEDVHFALAPGATAGQATWVATVHKAWLAAQLAALEKAHVPVERVVPSSWPDEMPLGHFGGDPAALRLVWADKDGVASLGLAGSLARSMLPQWQSRGARWSATPAVAAPAERWLGAPVMVMSDEQRALQASRSLWNLRQFDLAARHRGAQALRDAWRRFQSPGWRPVRWGAYTLIALQLVALNLWALHQRAEVSGKQEQMVALLRATHPQVRAVLDAPAQMQRETDALRGAAGRPGETDVEVMMQVAAAAWPEGLEAVDTLRYEPGKLTLSAGSMTADQLARLRQQLGAAGWAVASQEGKLVITRGTGGAS